MNSKRTYKIANLISFCNELQCVMRKLITENVQTNTSSELSGNNPQRVSLCKLISYKFEYLDKLLFKKKILPTQLPLPSYRAFVWLRYLSKKEHFSLHLAALSEFNQLLNGFDIKNHRIMKVFRLPINLSLKYMPYLFRVQVKRHEIDFAIHENFSLAPQEIKIALLQAALNADKRSLGLVRIYSAGQNFQGLDKIITAGDGRPANSSQGSSFNLTDVFQRVNQQYFHNSMEPPQLTWSQKRTHRKLGSYAADTDTVTISRTFDHASTPEYVIDFIMYHELLHKWLGVNKARSHNHNKRFKVLEKQFRQYTQAENYIRRLNQINRLQTNRKFKLIN